MAHREFFFFFFFFFLFPLFFFFEINLSLLPTSVKAFTRVHTDIPLSRFGITQKGFFYLIVDPRSDIFNHPRGSSAVAVPKEG